MIPRGTLAYRVQAAAGFALLRTFEAAIRRTDGDHVFHDPQRFPWIAPLEARWREIRAELDALLADRREIPNFDDLSEEQKRIVRPNSWKSFILRAYGLDVADNRARCPRTTALLDAIPGMTTAMFSILQPGARLLPHRGPFKGVLRLHLGLLVPVPAPACAIRVAGETRGWEEGKSLVFDDTHEHEAWNESGEIRVVLFVDFIRDLPFPLGLLNRGMIRLIGASPFVQNMLENVSRMAGRVVDTRR